MFLLYILLTDLNSLSIGDSSVSLPLRGNSVSLSLRDISGSENLLSARRETYTRKKEWVGRRLKGWFIKVGDAYVYNQMSQTRLIAMISTTLSNNY